MVIIGIVTLILAISAIIINSILNMDSRGYNYRVTLTYISFSDILCSLSLLTLTVADRIYDDSYFESEHIWKQNFFCYSIGTGILASKLMYLFSTNLLAVSSLQVTKFPFDSKFLEKVSPKFVIRILLAANILIIIFSCGIMGIQSVTGDISNGFCILIWAKNASYTQLSVSIGTVILNTISLISLPITYLSLYKILKTSEIRSQREEQSIVKYVFLSFRNHVGWLSEMVVLLFIMVLEKYPHQLLLWYTAVVLPLNSITSPVVLTHAKLIQRMASYLHQRIKRFRGNDIPPVCQPSGTQSPADH